MGAIVLFDGVCNFCNSSINFVIEHDHSQYFKFAPLQSEMGQELREKFGIDQIETDSVILIEGEKAFTRSSAALQIAGKLDGVWSWLSVFKIIPLPLRDYFYKLFAKNRYRLFGKKDVCMMPTAELRKRFLN